MLQPAYKVLHWYPYPTITTAYDAWGNSTEETPVEEYYLNKYEESGEPSSSDFFYFFLCGQKRERFFYKIFILQVQKREGANFKPHYMRMGGSIPPLSNNNKQKSKNITQ